MTRPQKLIQIGLGAAILAMAVALLGLWTPDLERAELAKRYGAPPAQTMAVDGLTVYYKDSGPQDAPVLLFLHGFGSSLQTWDDWSAKLDPQYRVIRLDLPGFGLSDKPKKIARHRIAWHVQVLREFLARAPAVCVHAPREMAPLLSGLTLPIQWHEPRALSAHLRDAPYPDSGHMAGPRALRTLLAALAPMPPPKRS